MSPVIPAVVGVKAPMISVAPVGRRTPVATSPRPMVIAPSPAATCPDVSRYGTSRHDLNDRCRHWRWHDDRGRSHQHRSRGDYNRGWKWDSDADTDMNPSVYSGDSHSRQGQDCDGLFHIHYCLDATGGQTLVINRFPFCNPSSRHGRCCLIFDELRLRIQFASASQAEANELGHAARFLN